MTNINIGLQPEYIISAFGVRVTNSFVTALAVTAALGVVAILFFFFKEKKNIFTNLLRVFMFELLKLTDTVTNDRELSNKVIPLIATFFLFIATANLLALTPGFLGSWYVKTPRGSVPFLRSPNSDLTVTLALAIVSVVSIQFFSLQALGVKKYISRFLNFRNPLAFMLGFFEMLSEGVKVLSFSMRLFGNMFAGELLLFIIAFLVPYVIPLPFMILEVFVGLIQAFIFAMLTLTFVKTSMMRQGTKPAGVSGEGRGALNDLIIR